MKDEKRPHLHGEYVWKFFCEVLNGNVKSIKMFFWITSPHDFSAVIFNARIKTDIEKKLWVDDKEVIITELFFLSFCMKT